MKKIVLLLLMSVVSGHIFGQSEKAKHKIVADKFEKYYNAGKYDSIFVLFSDGMRKFSPLDKTITFLSGLKKDAGQITKRQFVNYKKGATSYKTNFEKALLSLDIAVDNDSKIAGYYIGEFVPIPERNVTQMQLPFKNEWTVTWGGDTKELNYHVESKAQKNAFDFLITDNKGETHQGKGEKNEDYYAFGKELFAPCDGEIVLAVDGVKDNQPGIKNPIYVPGNSIFLKTEKNEYMLFAHFKQFSIVVKQGQKVKQGQLLGLCGNSGNSTEPHLHFHLQDIEDMVEATGIKCYFHELIVNGKKMTDYSPIKNDKIKIE